MKNMENSGKVSALRIVDVSIVVGGDGREELMAARRQNQITSSDFSFLNLEWHEWHERKIENREMWKRIQNTKDIVNNRIEKVGCNVENAFFQLK